MTERMTGVCYDHMPYSAFVEAMVRARADKTHLPYLSNRIVQPDEIATLSSLFATSGLPEDWCGYYVRNNARGKMEWVPT